MSSIKRYLAEHERSEELVQALEAVLDDGRIDHPVGLGIAKKIVAERSVNGLSQAQLDVFEKFIQPEMNIKCEGHCDGDIPWNDLPSTLANMEGMYCASCSHDLARQMKD